MSLSLSAQLGGPPPGPRPGDPLPGLTPAQLAAFRAGAEDFSEIETVEDGLGPAFNGVGCSGCHNLPALGGGGNISVIRAGTQRGGQFEAPQGGSLIHLFSTPGHECQPKIPQNANVLARRVATPLFGAGLVEAIPDAAILALERAGKPDGIRGRAAMVIDPVSRERRVGRFGWKAQHATLLAFAGDAYVNEMGITNDIFPTEVGSGLSAQQLAVCDTVADPEDKRDPVTGLRGLDHFTNFMRFLAPAPRGQATREGEQVFLATGCASCHLPLLQTGAAADPVFRNRPVAAYSDFLLHEVGTGDGIEQGAARPNEIKTAPLWGLRFRKQLLHDGRALNVTEAIGEHGGEARMTRDRFDRLPLPERQALLHYLSTL